MDVLNEVLEQAGLDKTEALVYTTLLDYGALTVLEISTKANLKRTNLYNVLENLEKCNLVIKVEQNNPKNTGAPASNSRSKTTKYFPQAPREIQKLLDHKEDQVYFAKNTFDILLDDLQSKYNIVSHKPTITYLEGIGGLQKVYDDINDTGKDILLLRSTYDDKRKDVDRLIQKQITEQVKRNIHARVIGPPEYDAKDLQTKYDKLHLVEERFVSKFPFNVPAQIIVYGNKTAVATIRKDIIITLIDNLEITQTFRVLFNFIWQYSTPEHEALIKGWK